MNKKLFPRTSGGVTPAPPADAPATVGGTQRPEPAIGLKAGWYPGPRIRRLATAGLAGLLAAVVTGHAALVLLAAPALAALALVPRRPGQHKLAADVTLSGTRCVEGENLKVTVNLAELFDEVTVSLEPRPLVTLASGPAAVTILGGAGEASAHWVLRPQRWGRYSPGTVRVTCRSGMGGWETVLAVDLETVDVYPRPQRVRPRLVPAELLRRIGEHTGRAVGEGVEFTGIRPYVPGDSLRDLNRAVSIRRGQPHINQRAASRAADLVVMIDTFSEVGPPGASTLDVAVHGAAALASAYLRVSDRVGIVVVGGLLRWLGPAPGGRHFYRIAEMMLDAAFDSYATPDLGRIPRTALPPGTMAVLFSPLLDQRVLGAVTDLRQRGFPLIIIDTLRHEPPVTARSGTDQLALRVWRLSRKATRARLAEIGVPVLRWGTDGELDGLLVPLRMPSGRPPAGTSAMRS